MFTFLFDCDAKRKDGGKEKHAKERYRFRRHKTANAVICVFACRQKSLSAPKGYGAHQPLTPPLSRWEREQFLKF